MINSDTQAGKILEYMIMIPGRKINTGICMSLLHIPTISQRMPQIKKEINKDRPLILMNKHGQPIKYYIEEAWVTEGVSTFKEYWLEPVPVEVAEPMLELK